MTDKEFFDWLIDYIFECDENDQEVVAEVICRKLIKAGKLKRVEIDGVIYQERGRSMSRYIDAGKLMKVLEEDIPITDNPVKVMASAIAALEEQPAADVRENITARKVIGGGEHDGATCWFECSRCGKTVDVNDKYCSECGARFEE